MAAHAAHICTQNFIFLNISLLSVLSFVCKIKKLCANRPFCVQTVGVCAVCVQTWARCVQVSANVCCFATY